MSPGQAKAIEGTSRDRLLFVVGTGGALALVLIRIRGWEAGLGWQVSPPWAIALKLAALSYYDFAYVSVLTGAFTAGLLLAHHRPRAQRVLTGLFVVLAIFSLAMAYVNEKALEELGRPLTYQWLYYSDFLRSIDAYNAMQALVSWRWLRFVMVRCLWFLALSYVIVWGLRWLAKRLPMAWLAIFLVAGPCLVLRVGHHELPPATKAVKLQNPIVALLASAAGSDEHSLLAAMPTSVPPTDFLPVGARAPSESRLGYALREQARQVGLRNVLIVVLESVPAQYLGAYGARYGATPSLDRYRAQARLFTRAYAHVPTTVHSLTTLLLSVYHPHSFRVLTKEYPEVRLPSLSAELKRRGYRTAFFSSADNRFQRQDTFLRARQFDQLYDYRSFDCGSKVFVSSTKRWPYLDGVSDECAVNGIGRWVGEPSAAPFFAVFWTMQTHFPYFPAEAPTDFGVGDSTMNRYLSALRETDRAIGGLLAALDQQRVLDSTLVVLVGDHGEAFGQHRHYVHGVDLYEEEVHIPLMLINRRLFHGEADSTVGGLIDIAPTIMDLLGDSLPKLWQGRSLFDGDRTGRAYLFTYRSRVLFGYREGGRKVIYDAGGNTTELYDLEADPGEKLNVAAEAPDFVLQAKQRLAAWVQYQRRFLKDFLVPDAR